MINTSFCLFKMTRYYNDQAIRACQLVLNSIASPGWRDVENWWNQLLLNLSYTVILNSNEINLYWTFWTKIENSSLARNPYCKDDGIFVWRFNLKQDSFSRFCCTQNLVSNAWHLNSRLKPATLPDLTKSENTNYFFLLRESKEKW